MSSENSLIKFQGIHPSSFTRSYLKDKMDAIQDESPYGSNLNATFSRRNHLFKGIVTIHSSHGKFFAAASGTKLKEVTHSLMDQIRKQLGRWKAQRFRPSKFKLSDRQLTHKEESHEHGSVG